MQKEDYRQSKGSTLQLGSSAGLGVRKTALLAPPGSSREIHSLGRVQGLSLVGGPCYLLSEDEVLVVVTWNHGDLVTKCNKLRLLVNIAERDREMLQTLWSQKKFFHSCYNKTSFKY